MGTRTSDGSKIPLNLDEEQLEMLRKALQKYNDTQEVLSIYKEDDGYADEFTVGDMVDKQRDLEREKELYRLKSLEEDRRGEEEKLRLMREVEAAKKAERERKAKEERDRDECEAREDWGCFEIKWHVGVAMVNPKLSAGIKQLKARNNPCTEVFIDEFGHVQHRKIEERMKIPMKKPDIKQEELEGWGSF